MDDNEVANGTSAGAVVDGAPCGGAAVVIGAGSAQAGSGFAPGQPARWPTRRTLR
jgi:hypothetical protein